MVEPMVESVRRNIRSGSPYEDVFGYCRAVRVGNTIHVAGTCAAPPHIEGCDAHEQAVSALAIIQDALAEGVERRFPRRERGPGRTRHETGG